MSGPLSRSRNKAPDPNVRCAIVNAASRSIHDQGVRGLNIAAVLERAQLSTRAFYRHFDSKDQLVAAVFLELARDESQRLRARRANTACLGVAVAEWIEGRLEARRPKPLTTPGGFDEGAWLAHRGASLVGRVGTVTALAAAPDGSAVTAAI